MCKGKMILKVVVIGLLLLQINFFMLAEVRCQGIKALPRTNITVNTGTTLKVMSGNMQIMSDATRGCFVD